MMGYGYGWGPGAGMGVFGWIGMLVFLVAIIVGLVILVRVLNQGSQGHPGSSAAEMNRALNIARERFARGEISKEQFEALKRDLGH